MKKNLFAVVSAVCLSVFISVTGMICFAENSVQTQAAADIIEPVAIKINGQYLKTEYAPVIMNNTTIVPLRDVMETLGWTVEWVEADESINITNDKKAVNLKIGSNEMKLDGKSIHLDVAPMLAGGTVTFVPLRAVSEALGAVIGWDADNSTATIFTLTDTSTLSIGDYRVKVGSTVSELTKVCSEPTYKIIGEKGLVWYIYAEYPSAFMAAATDGGIVCGYYTSSTLFSTSDGYVYGSPLTTVREYTLIDKDGYNIGLYYDTKDKMLCGVSYMLDGFSGYQDVSISLNGQARLGLDILNSFRYAHGKYTLNWDIAAAASCTDHSYYMAKTGELTHTSADGSSAIERYLKYVPDAKWRAWGENICAEADSIFTCINGWINSDYHRSIMLSDKTRAGIGFVYAPDGKYKYCATMFLIK